MTNGTFEQVPPVLAGLLRKRDATESLPLSSDETALFATVLLLCSVSEDHGCIALQPELGVSYYHEVKVE